MKKEEHIIKKYPNRRLYDMNSSQYITLETVRQFVMEGTSFKVIDTQTQADITRGVLLQIILNQEDSTLPIFSLEVLQHFIRIYGTNMEGVLNQYLEQNMAFFIQQQKQLQDSLASNSLDWATMPLAWSHFFLDSQQTLINSFLKSNDNTLEK